MALAEEKEAPVEEPQREEEEEEDAPFLLDSPLSDLPDDDAPEPDPDPRTAAILDLNVLLLRSVSLSSPLTSLTSPQNLHIPPIKGLPSHRSPLPNVFTPTIHPPRL